MKKHAWLVALMFLAGSLTVGIASASHSSVPGPQLNLVVNKSLVSPDSWSVQYTAHAWDVNVSASVQANGVVLAQSSNTLLFVGTATIAASSCDSIRLQATVAGQMLRHTVQLGAGCTGALDGLQAPQGATSRGAKANSGGQHESYGELRGAGVLSAHAASLQPAPTSWSQGSGLDRVSATVLQASPWCGSMVLSGQSSDLLNGAQAIGVKLTHAGSHCPLGYPPEIDLGPNQTKKMKGDFVLQGTVTDFDTANHLVTIDWGDGNTGVAHSVAGIFSTSHAYGGKGSWVITACATDNLFTDCDTMTITQGGGGDTSDGGSKGGGKPDKGDGGVKPGKGGGRGKK